MAENILDSLTADDGAATDGRQPPSPKVIDWIHARASTGRKNDLHHRIGFGIGDVADGRHTHNGKDSVSLWEGATLTDLAGGATLADTITKVNQIIALLRQKGA